MKMLKFRNLKKKIKKSQKKKKKDIFSNAVKNLKIQNVKKETTLLIISLIQSLRQLWNLKIQSSVTAIKKLNNDLRFNSCRASAEDAVKEIKKISTQKTPQSTVLPVEILKDNSDIFGNYICDCF